MAYFAAYLTRFTPNGAGYFDHFVFLVADPDFKHTLADEAREIFADPADVKNAGSAIKYLENVLENAA